jgi:hypothetical protein
MKQFLLLLLLTKGLFAAGDGYLELTLKQSVATANAQRMIGLVGSKWEARGLATDRSINYKLRATWMTPEVIRAAARVQQIAHGLSEAETRHLVVEAEHVGDTVVMIELHGREGSGVIPSEWEAMLGPKSAQGYATRNVRGTNSPLLRDVPALVGAERRDYAYDVFWMVFPLRTEIGSTLFGPADSEAELTVRIYDKVGRLHWKIPASIRSRSLASK